MILERWIQPPARATGGADDRYFTFTPVIENTLFDALPQGSDISIRDGSTPTDGIEYVVPYLLEYQGQTYLPLVRVPVNNAEYADPSNPGVLSMPIGVDLKKWNGSQFC